jgi:hypothetical protein
MHECCTSRSLICCLAILGNEGDGSGSRNRLGEICRWLDVIWVTTTRNRNAELWMKSMSLDEVHVEVSNSMVGKVVAITSTSCKRKHVKMKVLQLRRLPFCFCIYVSETNLIFAKKDMGLDNCSIIRLLLSTSSHEVRKEYQGLVIVVCILGLWLRRLILQR